jgi:hypothetical protein
MDPFLRSLLISDGRDKLTKTIQYVFKICIWGLSFHLSQLNTDVSLKLERIAKGMNVRIQVLINERTF